MEDKPLEELVLSDLYYDIARNLPPDDVLAYMHQDDLITDGQRDQYKMMKANNQPEVERSEYLLECFRKGEPGFLKKLCTILRKIPPSGYIADKVEGIPISTMKSSWLTATGLCMPTWGEGEHPPPPPHHHRKYCTKLKDLLVQDYITILPLPKLLHNSFHNPSPR